VWVDSRSPTAPSSTTGSRPALIGKTVNNHVSVLRKAMHLAVADKAIATNPVSAVARAKHQKPLPDPFSREEAEAMTPAFCAKQLGHSVEMSFRTHAPRGRWLMGSEPSATRGKDDLAPCRYSPAKVIAPRSAQLAYASS
jgi:hypothetical protein